MNTSQIQAHLMLVNGEFRNADELISNLSIKADEKTFSTYRDKIDEMKERMKMDREKIKDLNRRFACLQEKLKFTMLDAYM